MRQSFIPLSFSLFTKSIKIPLSRYYNLKLLNVVFTIYPDNIDYETYSKLKSNNLKLNRWKTANGHTVYI